MKKKYVLKKNYQFQKVINLKKQIISKTLILYFQKNNTNLKVGISVSKKIINAVMRNKHRRQVRSILDKLKLWNINVNAVLILRKPFLKLSFDNKKNEIKNIFERLKIKK